MNKTNQIVDKMVNKYIEYRKDYKEEGINLEEYLGEFLYHELDKENVFEIAEENRNESYQDDFSKNRSVYELAYDVAFKIINEKAQKRYSAIDINQEKRNESIKVFKETLNEIYEIIEKHNDFEELFEELEGWDYELDNDEGQFDFQYKNICSTVYHNAEGTMYNGATKIELSNNFDYYLHSDYDYFVDGTEEGIIYKLERFDFEKLNVIEAEQFNTDKITVEFTDNVTENRKESLFYNGQVAIVEHDDYPGYTLSIEARGEVRISDDEELLRESDLPFDHKDPNKRLMTDQDLERNIKELNDTYNEKYEGNYSMGNNNWYEIFIIGPGDHIESVGDVNYLIDDAIKNAVDNFEEIIKNHLITEEEIVVRADFISIYDGKGEIVRWTRDEWLEDPDILIPIVNAAMIVADSEDKRTVREILKQEG